MQFEHLVFYFLQIVLQRLVGLLHERQVVTDDVLFLGDYLDNFLEFQGICTFFRHHLYRGLDLRSFVCYFCRDIVLALDGAGKLARDLLGGLFCLRVALFLQGVELELQHTVLLFYAFDHGLLLIYLVIDELAVLGLLLAQRTFDLMCRNANLPLVNGCERVRAPNRGLACQTYQRLRLKVTELVVWNSLGTQDVLLFLVSQETALAQTHDVLPLSVQLVLDERDCVGHRAVLPIVRGFLLV